MQHKAATCSMRASHNCGMDGPSEGPAGQASGRAAPCKDPPNLNTTADTQHTHPKHGSACAGFRGLFCQVFRPPGPSESALSAGIAPTFSGCASMYCRPASKGISLSSGGLRSGTAR